jgi:hypothetical protein
MNESEYEQFLTPGLGRGINPGKSELKEVPPSPSSAANLLRRPYPRESPRGPSSPRPFLGINESKR